MQVEELIFKDWEPGTNKIVWCLVPYEQAITKQGTKNLLAHADYKNEPIKSIEEALCRSRVKDAFDKHYDCCVLDREAFLLTFLDRMLDIHGE